MMALVVVLVLQPVLADDGDLRLVATGLGNETVTWSLDGTDVARTADREAVTIPVLAGAHRIEARSLAVGRWQAVARPDPVGQGAAYVPAWSAIHEPDPQPVVPAIPGPPAWRSGLAWILAGAAALLLAWPGRRGLEGLRRGRRA